MALAAVAGRFPVPEEVAPVQEQARSWVAAVAPGIPATVLEDLDPAEVPGNLRLRLARPGLEDTPEEVPERPVVASLVPVWLPREAFPEAGCHPWEEAEQRVEELRQQEPSEPVPGIPVVVPASPASQVAGTAGRASPAASRNLAGEPGDEG